MALINPSGEAGKPVRFFALRDLFTALEVLGDFIGAIVASQLAFDFATWHGFGAAGSRILARPEPLSILIGILVPMLSKQDGAYRGCGSLLKIRETERSLRAAVFTWFVLIPLRWLFPGIVTGAFLGWSLLCLPICEVLQKQATLRVIKAMYEQGLGVQRVIVYGAGGTGRRLMSAIWASPKLGWRPILAVDDNPALAGQRLPGLGYRRADVGQIVSGPIGSALLREKRCDLLIVAIPNLEQGKYQAVLTAAEEAKVRVAVLSDRSMPIHDWMESVDVDGLFLMSIGTPHTGGRYDAIKRILDFVLAAGLLTAFSPFFLLCVVIICLESRGGALFRQERVGKLGRRFRIWKFRTMYADAPAYEVSPATPMDPRITPFGRFLRKTSFDELPQLLNVLSGEMSLVGPRPEMPFVVQKYSAFQLQRLQIVPGITGLWQLSADRQFHIHENIQYDMYYIRNRGFFVDLAILFHTVFFAIRGI